MSGDIFGCHSSGGGLRSHHTVPSPEMLPNTQQCTRRVPHYRKLFWPKLLRVPSEVEKLKENDLVARKSLNTKTGAR